MTGAITTVILPGLGAVCPECFGRGFVGGLPIDGREIYTFSMTGPRLGAQLGHCQSAGVADTAPTQAEETRPG